MEFQVNQYGRTPLSVFEYDYGISKISTGTGYRYILTHILQLFFQKLNGRMYKECNDIFERMKIEIGKNK